MSAKLSSALCVAVVVIATTATAHATEVVDVASAHHKHLLGVWNCRGFAIDPHSGHKKNTVGTWEFREKFNKYITDTLKNVDAQGHHYVQWGWTQYDHDSGKLSRRISNSRGAWGRYESKGWGKEGAMVWEGHVNIPFHGDVSVEETLTQKGEDKFWVSVRMQGHVGRRFDVYKASCARHGKADTSHDQAEDDLFLTGATVLPEL